MSESKGDIRAADIERIIRQALEDVETKHGLYGLDHVARLVKYRIDSLIHELEAARTS